MSKIKFEFDYTSIKAYYDQLEKRHTGAFGNMGNVVKKYEARLSSSFQKASENLKASVGNQAGNAFRGVANVGKSIQNTGNSVRNKWNRADLSSEGIKSSIGNQAGRAISRAGGLKEGAKESLKELSGSSKKATELLSEVVGALKRINAEGKSQNRKDTKNTRNEASIRRLGQTNSASIQGVRKVTPNEDITDMLNNLVNPENPNASTEHSKQSARGAKMSIKAGKKKASEKLKALKKQAKEKEKDGGALGDVAGVGAGAVGAGTGVGGALAVYSAGKLAMRGVKAIGGMYSAGEGRHQAELNAKAVTGEGGFNPASVNISKKEVANFVAGQVSNAVDMVTAVTTPSLIPAVLAKRALSSNNPSSNLLTNSLKQGTDMNQLGYSSEQANNYMTTLAKTRGYSSYARYTGAGESRKTQFGAEKSMQEETMRLASLENQYGLGSGFLVGLSKYQQSDNNTGRNASKRETSYDVQRMVSVMKNAGAIQGEDYSRVGQFAETMNQRAFSAGNLSEVIDTDVIMENMAKFSKVGGSFDTRMSERMGQVSQALINPNNDFKQSFNFSVLRRMNPDASYVQLKKMEENGIGQKGFLEGNLKSIQELSGEDNDNFDLLTASRFNIRLNQAQTLREGYQRGDLADMSKAEVLKINSGLKSTEEVLKDGGDATASGKKISAYLADLESNIPTSISKASKDVITEFTDYLKKENQKTDEKAGITNSLLEKILAKISIDN